jgi:beta-phosphoglucomutase
MGYTFMKYKGIIFDLDGVIVSTDRYHYLAWKQIADKLGIPFTPEDNNRLRGVSRLGSLEIILGLGLRTMADREKQELMEEKNRIYRRMLEELSLLSVAPEVKNTLSVLKKRSIKMAIGSSSKNARLILEKIGLLDIFDAISDGENIGNSKPDPEIFNKAAIMLKIENKDILVVEDSSAGIEAARRGGFDSVGIGNAFEDKTATYRIKSLVELLSL